MSLKPNSISPLAMSRQQAVERILSDLKWLPTSFAVPMKVLELKRQNTAGITEFAQVISVDLALLARILALANSAAFTPTAPVTRLSTAIGLIGLKNVLPLVFGLSFAGLFNKLGLAPSEQAVVWRASVLKGTVARECARQVGAPFASPAEEQAATEEAFLVGLFLDISLPILHTADASAWPEYSTVLDVQDADRVKREHRIFGMDHAEASGRCARALSLPDIFVKIAAVHHSGVEALTAAGAGQLTIPIETAAALPHRLPALNAKVLQTLASSIVSTIKLSPHAARELVRAIAEGYDQTMAMLCDPQDTGASFKQFLQNLGAEVAESTQAAIGCSATQISTLKGSEQRLRDEVTGLEQRVQQADFDGLTCVLTRVAFLGRLESLLTLSRKYNAQCAVGFIDLDDFKKLNDTFGHPAGDAALVELANTVTGLLRGRGMIGRMGGDEFVFALISKTGQVDRDSADLSAQAAKIRLVHAGQRMELSTSIGILSMGVPAPDARPELLIKEADQLMYHAKRAGKGRAAIGRTGGGPVALLCGKAA